MLQGNLFLREPGRLNSPSWEELCRTRHARWHTGEEETKPNTPKQTNTKKSHRENDSSASEACGAWAYSLCATEGMKAMTSSLRCSPAKVVEQTAPFLTTRCCQCQLQTHSIHCTVQLHAQKTWHGGGEEIIKRNLQLLKPLGFTHGALGTTRESCNCAVIWAKILVLVRNRSALSYRKSSFRAWLRGMHRVVPACERRQMWSAVMGFSCNSVV